MSRKIVIDKYQGNTHYNVHVIDSFGQEHHVGYFDEMDNFSQSIIEDEAETIWSNEVKREITPMERAIKECIDIDKKSGILTGNRDGLD
jgi:hypothetical protein